MNVVELENVRRDAVGQRGAGGRRSPAPNTVASVDDAEARDDVLCHARRRLERAGQRGSEPVENRAMRVGDRLNVAGRRRLSTSRRRRAFAMLIWCRSRGPHDSMNGGEEVRESCFFLAELPAADACDGVVACALLVGSLSPFGGEPPALAHALERRIERALVDLQHVIRESLDVRGNAVAVHWARAQSFEHEHVEHSGE